MDAQRAGGLDVMSIPHNSNASNGEMFASETYEGGELTADYAVTRMRNEPVMEITQIKGTSETHPSLSPNDEWANFELYETLIGSAAKSSPHVGDYARTALARGLALADTEGFNPFKFGFIGSSDTHIGAGPFIEEKFWGKFPVRWFGSRSPPFDPARWRDELGRDGSGSVRSGRRCHGSEHAPSAGRQPVQCLGPGWCVGG